jgi:hypothetical protein
MNEAVFRFGFSGHQRLGNEAINTSVSRKLRELLATYQEQARQGDQELLVSR